MAANNSLCLLEVTAPGMYTAQEFGQLFPAEAELKFKVQGESRMVAVLRLDSVDAALAGMKSVPGVSVVCDPLIPYESYARGPLGVTDDEVEINGKAPPFEPSKETFWVQFDVGYQGRSQAQLVEAWHDEAIAALSLFHSGTVPVILYKTVFKREVHLFIQQEGVALDGLPYGLPLFKALGDQVQNKVKAVSLIA